MITEVVDACLAPVVERLRSGEQVDVVAEMARPVPTLVIARMLGIPTADHPQFSDWSDGMVKAAEGATDASQQGAENLRLGMAATAALNEYLTAMMSAEHRPGCPADLIGQMVDSSVSDKMTIQEMTASAAQLVFAGNETTAKLMATTLYALARFPDQRRLLRGQQRLGAMAEPGRSGCPPRASFTSRFRFRDAPLPWHQPCPAGTGDLAQPTTGRDP
jgi:cytochrome P450